MITSCDQDDTVSGNGLLKKYTIYFFGDPERTLLFKYNNNNTVSEIEIKDIAGTGDRKDIFYYNENNEISYVETYRTDSNILVGITEFEYENGLIVNQRRESPLGDFAVEVFINYDNGDLIGYEICNTENCSSGSYYDLIYSASGNNTLEEWFSRSNLSEDDDLLSTTEYEYDNAKNPFFGSNLSGQLFAYNFFYRIIPNENNAIKIEHKNYYSNGEVRETFNQIITNTYNNNNQPLVSSSYQNDDVAWEIFYEYY
jgi:hypothetical protein